MADNPVFQKFIQRLLATGQTRHLVDPEKSSGAVSASGEAGAFQMPRFSEDDQRKVKMLTVRHPDGRMSQYPPADRWSNWTEWDSKAWPRKKARTYDLVPTVCFNCESACGLLAYVDKQTYDIRKFEGNPVHPGSRGRNCAKGPATLNQTYDPERILYPLKRVGKRGEGKWARISWDQALNEIGAKMRASRQKRRDGIMYHVGRPGEDHYTNRCIKAWGVDGHNSHTNICSASARLGYMLWSGFDRPSPDHAHARVILLISSHLETGHYFNPHAQRIIEGKMNGAKLITIDPRLSNTASKSDIWMPSWPGSESVILLAIAAHLIRTGRYDQKFVERWVNWRQFLDYLAKDGRHLKGDKAWQDLCSDLVGTTERTFADFHRALFHLYDEYTFERAAEESQVPVERIREAAGYIADCDGRLAAHVWRAASIGNLGGWQVARCLFFLNVLTGSVGTRGGTSGNEWNKFVPKPFDNPPDFDAWNELQLPIEWPLAHYEMSFLLPHFLEEQRGSIDVYFTRVYNPMWINPDGFMWLKSLRDEERIGCHVALTPTWNESAWWADYVLPMGHAGERHDLMSQETHSSQWVAFRQPVRRVAMERVGKKVRFSWEANPGEVWEEAEFWVELSGRMDPDNSLGIRKHFESPHRPGELISQDEYWAWIFDHSIPGLPAAAAKEQLTPLAYMKKYGVFEILKENYVPYEKPAAKGVDVDRSGTVRAGFHTPSGLLEFYSPTMTEWGWKEIEYVIPWPIKSHVHPDHIDRKKGEMILLPNFRLPTLIHTRSANCKWLYEISHKNPVWMHPEDARRIGVHSGELVKVETEIGYFVDKVWVTEGIKPGVIAMSHHLGRWRLAGQGGVNGFAASNVSLSEAGKDHRLKITGEVRPYETADPDTSRIFWKDVGVHQNLTHAVHPDPVSGAHCWLQKAVNVTRASVDDHHGDVYVDTEKSMQVYRQWVAMTRPADKFSPDGNRRPLWLKRPLKPVANAYRLPGKSR
jgi:anaerobic selenocysteine-containing dehydrogenase